MLNRAITLLEPAEGAGEPDDLGNVRDLAPIRKDAWATVQERSGKEEINVDGIITTSEFTLFTFRVEYAPNLTTSWRIEYDGEEYDITAKRKYDNLIFWECHCEATT